MNHYFGVNAASELGIAKAVLLQNIAYWITINAANNVNEFEGKYWTYNSSNSFHKLMPYIPAKTIARYLRELEEDGYIESGVFSETGRDKTKYYTLLKKGHSLSLPSSKWDDPSPKKDNVYKEHYKPDSKPKAKVLAEMQDQFTVLVIRSFNNIIGKQIKVTPQRHRLIEARNKDGNGMVQFEAVFKFKNKEWANDVDMKKYLRLETLLAPSHFQNYLEQAREDYKPVSKSPSFKKGDSVENEYGQ